MAIKWKKWDLQQFEIKVKEAFERGEINCPVHLSGGNEDYLLNCFQSIKEDDYVIATHRSHFHYLLKGGDENKLFDEINGLPSGICGGKARSMNICDPAINFYSTAIVGGGCAISCGIALACKKLQKTNHVFCFIGDGAEDSGHAFEAIRFGHSRQLPLTFIIEDNNYSTDSTKNDRWANWFPLESVRIDNPITPGQQQLIITYPNVIRYNYKRVYPHVGIGKHVTF